MFYPKYVYAVVWADLDNKYYVHFFLNPLDFTEIVNNCNRECTYILMQHKSTFSPCYLHHSTSYEDFTEELKTNYADNECEETDYLYVYSKFRFNIPETFLPPKQEWLETKLSFLQQRTWLHKHKPYAYFVPQKEQIKPNLFFNIFYDNCILFCTLDKFPIHDFESASYSADKVTWKKQIIEWRQNAP